MAVAYRVAVAAIRDEGDKAMNTTRKPASGLLLNLLAVLAATGSW